MLLELIAGSLIGAVVGSACAIIPGLGSVHSAIACGVLGIINPIAGAAAQITGYVTSTFLGSAKESLDASVSAEAEMIAAAPDLNEEYDSKQQCNSLFFAKVIGSGLGISAGVFLGGVLLPFTGIMSLTPWIVGLIILLMGTVFSRHWLLIGAIFLGSQALFQYAPLLGINNIVFCLGSALWVIPALLDKMQDKWKLNGQYEGTGRGINLPDPVKGVMASLIAVCSPGISPALLITATTRKGNVLSQLTLACAECIVTTFGLVGWLFGTVSGKSSLLIELSALGVPAGLWIFIIYGIAVALSLILLPAVYQLVKGLIVVPGIHLIALGLSVLTLLVSAGSWGLGLMAVGLVLHYVMRAIGAPKTIMSLIWAAPVL